MNKAQIVSELKFKAIRSSGAGGQHVNKVSSKVELNFDVKKSSALREIEKERISLKLSSKLNKENILILQCDQSRSQHKNKEIIIKRLLALLENALRIPKIRRKTKPKRAAIEKRIKTKKHASQKKENRRKPDIE